MNYSPRKLVYMGLALHVLNVVGAEEAPSSAVIPSDLNIQLHQAIRDGKTLHCLKDFLTRGANLDSQVRLDNSQKAMTPLERVIDPYTTKKGWQDTFRFLLENGANPNISDRGPSAKTSPAEGLLWYISHDGVFDLLVLAIQKGAIIKKGMKFLRDSVHEKRIRGFSLDHGQWFEEHKEGDRYRLTPINYSGLSDEELKRVTNATRVAEARNRELKIVADARNYEVDLAALECDWLIYTYPELIE